MAVATSPTSTHAPAAATVHAAPTPDALPQADGSVSPLQFTGAEVALDLSGVYKRFGREGGRRLPLRLPWARRAPARKPGGGHVQAVDGVSFQVRRGEIFGVLGANGSGKSTLIRLVSTLLIPDQGEVRVFGLDVVAQEERVKRLINRVSVEAAFFKKLSATENLDFAARLYGLDAEAGRRRAREILDRVGISRKAAGQPMEHMSRGMQQKVAIARAFLTAPVLLLLDEPTTGLDPRSKKDVQRFVLELRDAHDTTVVLTTHDMDEADRLCDRIAIINRGRVVALDTPAALKEQVARDDASGPDAPRALEGRPPTLEDVFMHLTGLTQDDAEAEGASPDEEN
jgi:ABC-2 type transport system ATP-binding protein